MLAKRLTVAVIGIPLLVVINFLGGWTFTLVAAAALAMAAWEYTELFKAGDFSPSRVLLIVGTVILVVGRYALGFTGIELLFTVMVLVAMGVGVFAYEAGRQTVAVDFGITLGGLLYVGWLGAYLISLRNLPGGVWWTLLALPSVWIADAGAFFVGRSLGRHHMSKRVSPKKTWEGYVGGVLFAVILTPFLAWLLQWMSSILPSSWGISPLVGITPWRAIILAFILSVITPLGDLGESMLKRPFGVKDSSNILPGHGGILDRLDTWLWAGVITFYMITWFWS